MAIGLSHYLTVAAILFTIGIFGIFLNRKNVIVIMMSIELMNGIAASGMNRSLTRRNSASASL